jgi:hypothetical protein
MAHRAKDNKAHGSTGNQKTSTKDRKRATKSRGSFGDNNGTVQHRTINPHKGDQ